MFSRIQQSPETLDRTAQKRYSQKYLRYFQMKDDDEMYFEMFQSLSIQQTPPNFNRSTKLTGSAQSATFSFLFSLTLF